MPPSEVSSEILGRDTSSLTYQCGVRQRTGSGGRRIRDGGEALCLDGQFLQPHLEGV